MAELKVTLQLPVEGVKGLQNMAKPPMLIDDLIPQGAIVIITAPSYTGKTFLALEMARAVATGSPFLGHYAIPNPGNVYLIEQDSPKYDTGALFAAMLRRTAEEYRGEYLSPLDRIYISWHPGIDLLQPLTPHIIANTIQHFSTFEGMANGPRWTIDEHGEYQEIDPEIVTNGARLVILDTLRACNTGDENDSGAMEKVMRALKDVRKATGATVVVLHHDNAAGSRLRGSTAIEGAADTIFRLSKSRKGKTISCTVRKARAVQPESFRFSINTLEVPALGTVKEVRFEGTIEAHEVEEADSENELLSYIGSRVEVSGADLKEWAALNGLSVPTLERRLRDLKGQLAVRRDGRQSYYKRNTA
jgi:hypothetical protein